VLEGEGPLLVPSSSPAAASGAGGAPSAAAGATEGPFAFGGVLQTMRDREARRRCGESVPTGAAAKPTSDPPEDDKWSPARQHIHPTHTCSEYNEEPRSWLQVS
jgi:hypothetical protein